MGTEDGWETEFDRRIALRLTPRSLTPRVEAALIALGYVLHRDDDSSNLKDEPPRAWLVDEERLDEMPSRSDAPDAQIILVATPYHSEAEDRRIVARVPRPGRLGAIYGALQAHLESNPRRTPRVETRLSARCIRADRRAIGAVLSLSEGGCLLRTPEKLRKGHQVNLQFALPEYGLVSTRAECRYKREGDAGMAFSEPPADIRQTIAHFVTFQLADRFDRGQDALAFG